MTLGNLISNYLAAGNTMADFSRESGLVCHNFVTHDRRR